MLAKQITKEYPVKRLRSFGFDLMVDREKKILVIECDTDNTTYDEANERLNVLQNIAAMFCPKECVATMFNRVEGGESTYLLGTFATVRRTAIDRLMDQNNRICEQLAAVNQSITPSNLNQLASYQIPEV